MRAKAAGKGIIPTGVEDDDIEPIFRVFHFAQHGSDVDAFVFYFVLGLNIGAVAEALALVEAAGVDPARVRQALLGGFAGSRILEVHGQRMIERSFTPGARITTQHKDMRQACELGASLGQPLPATELGRDLYARLIERGDGDLDHSALIRLLRDDDT